MVDLPFHSAHGAEVVPAVKHNIWPWSFDDDQYVPFRYVRRGGHLVLVLHWPNRACRTPPFLTARAHRQRNARLMQLESSRPVGARTLVHFARRNLADKLRKQGAGQAVTALLGGWNEVRVLAENGKKYIICKYTIQT